MAIAACLRGHESQLALKIFYEMPQIDLSPDVISYKAIICACSRALEWQLGLMLFKEMASRVRMENSDALKGLAEMLATERKAAHACAR